MLRSTVGRPAKSPDEMMKEHPPKMPFDVKRMAYGGFKTIVQA
jgi:uncharacterized protein YbaA (DUF1428 family)